MLRFFLLSFGYVVIQMGLTPIRLRLLTEILDEPTYGTLNLVLPGVNLLVFLLSLGMFEYLLRRLPGMPAMDQVRLYGKLLRVNLALVAAAALIGSPLLLVLLAPGGFGQAEVLPVALGLVTSAVMQFRIFFLLGCNDLFRFRAAQLLANDLWFFIVLAAWPFFGIGLTEVLWIWSGWLAVTMLATEPWGPFRLVFLRGPSPVPLREVMAFGLPLLPLIMGELLFRFADRAFVGHFLGAGAVGEYTATMNVALLVFLVGTQVVGLLVPKFNERRNALTAGGDAAPHRDPELRRAFSVMLRYGLVLGGFGAGVIAFLGWAVLDILVAEEFRDAAYILPWAAPASFFFLVHLVFSRVLIALDRSRLVGGLTLAAAVLNAGLNPLLIPAFGERGLLGAALATTISLAALCLATGAAVGPGRWIDWRALRAGRWLASLALGLAMYAASDHWLSHWHPIPLLTLNGVASVGLLLAFGLATPADLRDLFKKKEETT